MAKFIISTMTGKLKGFRAINTNTKTNPFCQGMQKTNAICKYCYSERMLNGIRKNCEPAWQKNSEIFSSSLLENSEIPILKSKVFRLSAHGELINGTHMENYNRIIAKNKRTFFGWWTKRIDLFKKNKQRFENVNYVYSNPKIDDLSPAVPKTFNKVFSVYTREFAKVNNIDINCKGASAGGCRKCMLCYTKNEVTHINEIKK
jgi:hypothetical protein